MPYRPGDSWRQKAARTVLNWAARIAAWRHKTNRNIYYLETSGLNALADQVDDYRLFDLVKRSLKIEFYISAIGVWEVLLNSDRQRKEHLLYWAQFNTSPYLLKSPTEIFVDYIVRGAPRKDRYEFWIDRSTSLSIGRVWMRIHRRIDRTIPVDVEQLRERSEAIRGFSRQLKGIVKTTIDKDRTGYEDDFFIQCMNALGDRFPQFALDKSENEELSLLTIVFVFFFVCLGMELDNTPVRKFWQQVEIEDPFDRLEHLIKQHPYIFVRGPILESAKMAQVQISGPKARTRGLIHDSLHSVFCYYADHVISGDNHFRNLRDSTDHSAFKRIIMADEFGKIWKALDNEWSTTKRGSH